MAILAVSACSVPFHANVFPEPSATSSSVSPAVPTDSAASVAGIPLAGIFSGDIGVSLSSTTSGATIHYTIDNSAPTSASPVYTGVIPVTGNGTVVTIKSFAAFSGKVDSPITTMTYTATYPTDTSVTIANPSTNTYASIDRITSWTNPSDHLFCLYGAYYTDNTIRKIPVSNLSASTIFAGGSGTQGFTDSSTDATTASFNNPRGICTDGEYLYVCDYTNFTIRRVLGTEVTTIAGQARVSGSTDGTGSSARFYCPNGICYDAATDALYVADDGNNMIRKIIRNGSGSPNPFCIVSTIAGNGTCASKDGNGTGAQFYYPRDLVVLGNYLYVSESYAVRRIDLSTYEVVTIAGTGSAGSGSDGIGTAASFANYLDGITSDGTNLYVSESGIIKKVFLDTQYVMTMKTATGGNGLCYAGGILYASSGSRISAINLP